MAAAVQPEVLDLRHFSASALRPLLEEESKRWSEVLRWDYRSSIELLLGYMNQHMLPGYCILEQGRPIGYTFAVYDGNKAVIGDVFARAGAPPGTEALLLGHLIETLQASPGVNRIEAQLLLHPAGYLSQIFRANGFRGYTRLMLEAELSSIAQGGEVFYVNNQPLRLRRWEELDFARASQLIYDCYTHHIDAEINQQYRSAAGAQRFLHNIVRFPGCGFFDAPASRVAEQERDGKLAAMLLASRVREDTAHITQFCVLPKYRRSGLGLALLRASGTRLRKDGFRNVTLTVTEANHAAMEFYRRQGFHMRHRFEAFTWGA